jgi:hypothetical protein
MSDDFTAGGDIDTGMDVGGVSTGGQGFESQGGVSSGVAGSEGVQSWYSSFPEEFQNNPNITKYDSIEGLLQGHVNAVQMMGRDKIPMPKTEDEFREVYQKLGTPGTKDGYEINLDPSIEFDPAFYSKEDFEGDTTWFKEVAHEANLSNKQANDLMNAYMKRQMGVSEVIQNSHVEALNQSKAELQKEWGNDYEANIKIASRMVDRLFGPGLQEALVTSGMSRNAQFMRGMANLGNEFLEEIGLDKKGQSNKSPNDLRHELANLQSHAAYFDRDHPEHKIVVEKVWQLQQRLSPDR